METLMKLYEMMCAGAVDNWDEVPVFANKDAEHDFGVWSWDDRYAIVGESRDVLAVRPYTYHNNRVVIDWDSPPIAHKG